MYSSKKKAPAKSKGLFDEVKDDIKEDGLRKQLKVKKDYKFKIGELKKLDKVKEGDAFKFQGKDFKMTKLLKKRIQLAINMMGSKK